jgi:hypothetical protein
MIKQELAGQSEAGSCMAGKMVQHTEKNQPDSASLCTSDPQQGRKPLNEGQIQEKMPEDTTLTLDNGLSNYSYG